MKKAALVTMVNKDWLEYAKQVFSGAHFNAGWKFDYILMTINIETEDLEWFKNKGIIIYQCDTLQQSIRVESAALKETIYRIYLFTEFFKQWEYILYIDTDVIIKGDLDCLLEHHGFMAVTDSNRNNLDWQLRAERSTLNPLQEHQYTLLKGHFDIKELTFNAGIISLHTSLIERNTFKELCDLYKENIELFANHMHDQVLLNIYFYKNWIQMPSQFNVYVNYDTINYNRSIRCIDAYILHFAGTKSFHKPWDSANHFYYEWLQLLLRAEGMDLAIRRSAKKTTDFDSIMKTSLYLSDGWERYRKKIQRRHQLLWHMKKIINN